MKRLKQLIAQIERGNKHLLFLRSIISRPEQTIFSNLDITIIVHSKLMNELGVYNYGAGKFLDTDTCKLENQTTEPNDFADGEQEKLDKLDKNRDGFGLVDAAILHDAVVCASTDECRYILNGVFLDKTNGKVVSTDGRRLYMNKQSVKQRQSVIIPSSVIKLLPKSGMITVIASKDGRMGLMEWTEKDGIDVSMVFKLVEGSYSLYKKILLKFPAKEMKTYAIDDKFKAHYTSFTKSDRERKHIEFSKSSYKVMDTEYDHARPAPEGIAQIALNPSFILDAVKMGFTKILVKDELSPAQLNHGDAYMIIMPMRLN